MAPATAGSAFSDSYSRISPPKSTKNIGHIHNEGVKDILRRASSYNWDPGSYEELQVALVAGARDYAAANGFDPDELEASIKLGALIATDRPDVSQAAREYAAHLKTDPDLRSRLADQQRLVQSLAERRARHIREGQTENLRVLQTDSTRYLDGGADILYEISDETVDMATAAANTDPPQAYWSNQMSDTAYQDALKGTEELADSSRYLWESMALQLWIDSGGDTTIFDPLVALPNAGNHACDQQSGTPVTGPFPHVVSCPSCTAAAIAAVAADVGQAIANFDNDVAHPIGSVPSLPIFSETFSCSSLV